MKNWRWKSTMATMAAATLAMSISCASPGAPQPPSLNLPKPVDDLRAVRVGDKVELSWSEPTQTTDRQNIRELGQTRLCVAVRQYPVAKCVESIRTLRISDLPPLNRNQQRERMRVLLSLPAGESSGFATYTVEVFNNHSRSAGLSNQVRVWLAPALEPPQGLAATVEAAGVRLRWSPNTAPAGLRSFMRVLRRGNGEKNFSQIAELPYATAVGYLDQTAQWEKVYEYKLTAYEQQPGVALAEASSEESATIKLMVHDAFPPAQPTGLEAVHGGDASKAFIDLSWTPNEERDLVGYYVWRQAEGEAAPKRMNDKPLTLPSWRDEAVKAGVEYHYQTQAVDRQGNRSALSEVESESIPTE